MCSNYLNKLLLRIFSHDTLLRPVVSVSVLFTRPEPVWTAVGGYGHVFVAVAMVAKYLTFSHLCTLTYLSWLCETMTEKLCPLSYHTKMNDSI